MATITQKVGEYSTLMGWYGTCGDAVCEPFDLNTRTDVIHQVFQFSDDGKTVKSFVSGSPSSLNDFETLECGKSYLIYLKFALSIESVQSLVLEHFNVSSFESGNLGGLTAGCLTEPITTQLTEAASAGDTTLQIDDSVTNEQVNSMLAAEGTTYVRIDEGTEIEEVAEVQAAGSFVLKTPLVYSHGLDATVEAFNTTVDTNEPVDPGEAMAETTVSDEAESLDYSTLVDDSDVTKPSVQSGYFLRGFMNPTYVNFIEFTSPRNGTLKSFDILMNNSMNIPVTKIRGYVAEDSPEDNTTGARWQITYDDIATAMAESTKRKTIYDKKFAWVTVAIKGEIHLKQGKKYRMNVDQFINCKAGRFGAIATGNTARMNEDDVPEVRWQFKEYDSGAPTFPFIKLKVGCGTIDFNGSKSTCGSDWYTSESVTPAESGLCFEDGYTIVDVDDKDGKLPYGGKYVYSGTTKRAVYLPSGLGTKVIDVPYYLRDNSLLSSYNEDFGVITISGGALGGQTKAKPGVYRKISNTEWSSGYGSSKLIKNADDTWAFVYDNLLQFAIISTGTSVTLNETVLEASFWNNIDIHFKPGTFATKNYMLFRKPGYVTSTGTEGGGYNWAIAKYRPESELLGKPTLIEVSSVPSDSPKCLLTHSEDHGEFGKLSLTASSTYKNTEVLVDPDAGPQGPDGGEPLSLTDYKPFLTTDSKCLYLQEGTKNVVVDGEWATASEFELVLNFSNLTLNEDADGYMKTTYAKHDGSYTIEQAMSRDADDECDWNTCGQQGKEVTVSAYLIKGSHLATYPSMKEYHAGIMTWIEQDRIDDSNITTAMAVGLGGSLLWNYKKFLNEPFSIKLGMKFDSVTAFNEWANGENLYIVVVPHNQTDNSNPNWHGSGFNYTIMNPFVFGGNEALPMCTDSNSESYDSVPDNLSFDVEYTDPDGTAEYISFTKETDMNSLEIGMAGETIPSDANYYFSGSEGDNVYYIVWVDENTTGAPLDGTINQNFGYRYGWKSYRVVSANQVDEIGWITFNKRMASSDTKLSPTVFSPLTKMSYEGESYQNYWTKRNV